MNELAKSLLVSFVEHFGQLYGEEFLVYNIHGLVHLSDDVKIHGNLNLISAFPYENFSGQLKRMVWGPCSPLSQVIRKLSEQENVIYNLDKEASPKVDKEHTDGPVPKCLSQQACQFKVLTFGDVVLKSKERDSCVKVESNLVLVQNIAQDKGIWYIVSYDYKEAAHFLYISNRF